MTFTALLLTSSHHQPTTNAAALRPTMKDGRQQRLPRPVIGLIQTTLCCMLISMLLPATTAAAAGCKIPKSYYKHVSCTADSRYFLAVRDIGLPVAIIDKNGKMVVELFRYQRVAADRFRNGLLPVQRGNKVGYLNMQGREVVPAVYDVLSNDSGNQGWARGVYDDRIVVKKDGKYGVITTANKVIVPFSAEYTSMSDYQGGRLQVSKRGQGSLWLDKQGKEIKTTVPAPVSAKSQVNSVKNSPNTATRQTPATPQAAPFTTLYPRQKDGRWGFVDEQEVLMITYSFDEVMPFSEGLAGVRIGKNWGFINLGGELVIPFRFDDAGVHKNEHYKGVPAFTFTGGKALIGSLKNGDKLCIDTNGNNVSCD